MKHSVSLGLPINGPPELAKSSTPRAIDLVKAAENIDLSGPWHKSAEQISALANYEFGANEMIERVRVAKRVRDEGQVTEIAMFSSPSFDTEQGSQQLVGIILISRASNREGFARLYDIFRKPASVLIDYTLVGREVKKLYDRPVRATPNQRKFASFILGLVERSNS